MKFLQMGPPDNQNKEDPKRNGKQSVKIQRTTSGEGQTKTRQGKASVRLSRCPGNVLQENKGIMNGQQHIQQGVQNDHILNEQTIQQMERDFQKDEESNQCGSSGQQSYVQGFLKVVNKRFSPVSDKIQNKNIADLTEQKQKQIDPV